VLDLLVGEGGDHRGGVSHGVACADALLEGVGIVIDSWEGRLLFTRNGFVDGRWQLAEKMSTITTCS